ncbi:hypothetical protein L1049_008522 [Liquidambar formosana]|uniref:Uncharacterized protein n=1 Tax=Liquidambar formosana TaxID=63359 RepID=A0AAP0S6H4_LIQFO
MMARAQTIHVNGNVYCSSDVVHLGIFRKSKNMNHDNFDVKDVNSGNIRFQVKRDVFTLHGRQVLLDANGNTLAKSRQKIFSTHDRCQVFRGDSSDIKDLLFTAQRYSNLRFERVVEVYLPSNTKEEFCDFRVKWEDKFCVFYAGEFSTIIAKMHRKHNYASKFGKKDKFMLEVQPGIDHAFIVALVVFIEDINTGGQYNVTTAPATTAAVGAVGIGLSVAGL